MEPVETKPVTSVTVPHWNKCCPLNPESYRSLGSLVRTMYKNILFYLNDGNHKISINHKYIKI